MLDTIAENQPERRPAILVCAYDAEDALWEDGPWAPPGARIRTVGPGDPARLAEVILHALDDADCRAVLLVGRLRRGDGFRLQMRSENRALVGGGKLSQTGPALARATAPAADIVRSLTDAGLNAEATSDSDDDAGSYLLYRILTALPDDADVPSIGLIRASPSLTPDDRLRGLQTAAAAMARHLSPLPRARSN